MLSISELLFFLQNSIYLFFWKIKIEDIGENHILKQITILRQKFLSDLFLTEREIFLKIGFL